MQVNSKSLDQMGAEMVGATGIEPERPYPHYQRRHDAILLSILENPLQTNKDIFSKCSNAATACGIRVTS